jgi:hypothetical protein
MNSDVTETLVVSPAMVLPKAYTTLYRFIAWPDVRKFGRERNDPADRHGCEPETKRATELTE